MNINLHLSAMFKVNNKNIEKLRTHLNQNDNKKNIPKFEDVKTQIIIPKITQIKKLSDLSQVKQQINISQNGLFIISNSILSKTNIQSIYRESSFKKTDTKILNAFIDEEENQDIITIKYDALYKLVKELSDTNIKEQTVLLRPVPRNIKLSQQENTAILEIVELELNPKASIALENEPKQYKSKNQIQLKFAKNNGFIDAIIFAGIIGFSVGLIVMSILAFMRL